MTCKWLPQTRRQHHPPVLLALAAANGDLAAIEIDVLHAQLETLLQAEPRAVQERRDQPRRAAELLEHLANFRDGEDDRHSCGALRLAHVANRTEIPA